MIYSKYKCDYWKLLWVLVLLMALSRAGVLGAQTRHAFISRSAPFAAPAKGR
jgi:hypothetical protein